MNDPKKDDAANPPTPVEPQERRQHGGKPETRHSFDIVKPDDRRALYRAMQGQDYTADDAMDQEITVRHYVIHWVELADKKSGELRWCPRCVLIDEQGTRYAFVSDGILSSMDALIASNGKGPWTPALKLKPLKLKSGGGNNYYTLDWIG